MTLQFLTGCLLGLPVTQKPATDTVDIVATDFMADSAYSIMVNFTACCTERITCKSMGFPFRSDTVSFLLRPQANRVSIPLVYPKLTECPFEFTSLFIGSRVFVGSGRDFIFVKNLAYPRLQGAINADCFQITAEDEKRHPECAYPLIFNLPGHRDTISIGRRQSRSPSSSRLPLLQEAA
ncbi:MAG: hypothetical protein IPN71_22725 [Fibrobacteres bacterium]|jgi:hypothetical protein|nr:hypothetical protein [Fibrobacterota bacterium]